MLITKRAEVVDLQPMAFAALRSLEPPMQGEPEEHFDLRWRLGPPKLPGTKQFGGSGEEGTICRGC